MDKEKVLEIIKNIEDQPNKVLMECQTVLYDEFNKTKELIIKLTRHIDAVEMYYNSVWDEINKRTK